MPWQNDLIGPRANLNAKCQNLGVKFMNSIVRCTSRKCAKEESGVVSQWIPYASLCLCWVDASTKTWLSHHTLLMTDARLRHFTYNPYITLGMAFSDFSGHGYMSTVKLSGRFMWYHWQIISEVHTAANHVCKEIAPTAFSRDMRSIHGANEGRFGAGLRHQYQHRFSPGVIKKQVMQVLLKMLNQNIQ